MNLDPIEWHGSVVGSECTLHQVAPYIGKMKSSMAKELINAYSSPGDLILDPFCGSGAIALESIIRGREIVCSDVNPYAVTITQAKLMPPSNSEIAIRNANQILDGVLKDSSFVSLDGIPDWVQSFFHPQTLREIVHFVKIVQQKNDPFLMACLLGILHHQRPGFLSYPASHLVPYLRTRKFPKEEFPELYSYRPLKPRLMKKIHRVYRRSPKFDSSLSKKCFKSDVRDLQLDSGCIDGIITSPPYMDALEYARDNRLRLWFLGVTDYKRYSTELGTISNFTELMSLFIGSALNWLRAGGYCVCVVGEVNRKKRSIDIAQMIANIATKQIGGFKLESIITDEIPNIRRARKGSYIKTESIIALKKKGGS